MLILIAIQAETRGQDFDQLHKKIEKERETIRIRNKILKTLEMNGVGPDRGLQTVTEERPTIKNIPKQDQEKADEPQKEPVILVVGEPACK